MTLSEARKTYDQLSKTERDLAKKMWGEGKTVLDIAKVLGVRLSVADQVAKGGRR